MPVSTVLDVVADVPDPVSLLPVSSGEFYVCLPLVVYGEGVGVLPPPHHRAAVHSEGVERLLPSPEGRTAGPQLEGPVGEPGPGVVAPHHQPASPGRQPGGVGTHRQAAHQLAEQAQRGV